jgi:prepilin-type N-terminal cleavage/methylation domain-containing protein
MSRRGFTLLEVTIASIVILVVLGAFYAALTAFLSGQREADIQRDALALAAAEAAVFSEPGCYPGTGRSERTEVSGRTSYDIAVEVVELVPGTRELTVSVAWGGGGSLDLSRRFYMPTGGRRWD